MRAAIVVLALIGAGFFGAMPAAGQSSSTPAELAQEGKTAEAVRRARRSPTGAAATLTALFEKADLHVTERQFPEAQSVLSSAEKFLKAYAKADKKKTLPAEALKGRKLRLEGILLSEQKEYDKAIPVLKEGLEIGKRAGDLTLQGGIHNNIGYALNSRGNPEEAAKEFTEARNIAESQKDSLRASSYNFNLGLALFQLKQWEPALDAFKRSAQQGQAAGKPTIEARATLYQGRTLSGMNAASPEAMKFFAAAQKIYDKLGDRFNSAQCFYLMGDHTAYSADFAQAARYGEQAAAGFRAAGDKNWLARSYSFLADMYGRTGNKQKSEEYKKKAAEFSSGQRPR